MNERTGYLAAALFVALYTASILYLNQLGAFPAEEALTILVVLGFGFAGLAWLLTIAIKPIPLEIDRPVLEGFVAIVLVVAIGAYLIYGRSWVDAQFPDAAHGGSAFLHEIGVVAGKLVAFVLLPFLVFKFLFGQTLAGFGLSRAAFGRLFGRDGIAALLIGIAICVFQYYAGRAAAPIRDGVIAGETPWLGGALTFAWLIFDVGLTEEFFFRGLLQERLAALFNSPLAGLFLMALVFGLVHAPGMVLRGAGAIEGLGEAPTPIIAAAYTVAVQSIAAFVFGVVWMRTRSLPAVIVIHAAFDLLSNMPDFVKTIGLMR